MNRYTIRKVTYAEKPREKDISENDLMMMAASCLMEYSREDRTRKSYSLNGKLLKNILPLIQDSLFEGSPRNEKPN
jgi:hypothetical protein